MHVDLLVGLGRPGGAAAIPFARPRAVFFYDETERDRDPEMSGKNGFHLGAHLLATVAMGKVGEAERGMHAAGFRGGVGGDKAAGTETRPHPA